MFHHTAEIKRANEVANNHTILHTLLRRRMLLTAMQISVFRANRVCEIHCLQLYSLPPYCTQCLGAIRCLQPCTFPLFNIHRVGAKCCFQVYRLHHRVYCYVDFATTLPGSQNDRPNDAWAGHSFDKSGHMFANSGYHTGPPSLVDQILLHNPNR